MSITKYECETHVSMSGLNKTMKIFTTEKHIMRKLDKYVQENPDSWKLVEVGKMKGEIVSKIYEAPRDLLYMKMKKRQMTEEQRQAAAERFLKYHESKNQDNTCYEGDEDFAAEDEDNSEQTECSSSSEGSESTSCQSGNSNNESPRLEPEKSKPKIVKVKSVIDEMER